MNASESPIFQRIASAWEDEEKARYLIQAELAAIRDHLRRRRLYPHLSRLVALRKLLVEIRTRFDELTAGLPDAMTAIDWESAEIRHQARFVPEGGLGAMHRLVVWVMPRLDELIEEGAAVHEFVESNMSLQQVGILPEYRQEGYMIIPDNRREHLNVFRFGVGLLPGGGATYKALKTRFLEGRKIRGGALPTLNAIKLDLIRRERELPNPATYFADTQLDFSFHQTILPVARRLLMARIHGMA